MRKNTLIKKAIALSLAVALSIGTIGVTDYSVKTVKAEEITKTYPWTPVEGGTTGDYIADKYEGVESGHVFENVTQQRLVDLLKSTGDYFIVFAGPEHSTSQVLIKKINQIAKENGVTKIYHYDTFVDGYQIDIKDSNTKFEGSKNTSVYQLWERVLEQLPENNDINNFVGEDTLLIAYSNDGTAKKINGSYLLKDGKTESDVDTSALENVLKSGKGGVRSNFDFYRTVLNTAVSFYEGEEIEALTEDDRYENIKQVTFAEVLDILQSPGEHYIAFYAVWCPNVRAIFSSTLRKAKANNKTLYVYDPTLGNQIIYGDDGKTAIGLSSVFSTRTSGINISYLYGEFAKYLGDIVTENNTKHTNSITYQPNGDLNAEFTSVKPWEDAEAGTVKNAIRLQTPFLFAYDNSKLTPVTKQWYHEDFSVDEEGGITDQKSGTVTEYMLYYQWVFPKEGAEILTDATPYKQGLTKVQWVQEAVANLSNVLGDAELPYKGAEINSYGGYKGTTGLPTEETTTPTEETTTPTEETTTPVKETTTPVKETTTTVKEATTGKVKVPAKAKISRVGKKKYTAKKLSLKIKKQSGVDGYQIKVYTSKKKANSNKNAIITKKIKKETYTIKSNKLKNKKNLYVKVRAYITVDKQPKYGPWSTAKKVTIKK